MPEGIRLHALPADAQGGEAGEAAVALVVGQEVVDDGGGDDVPNVLRVPARERLEGDAHALPCLVENRAACRAVAPTCLVTALAFPASLVILRPGKAR